MSKLFHISVHLFDVACGVVAAGETVFFGTIGDTLLFTTGFGTIGALMVGDLFTGMLVGGAIVDGLLEIGATVIGAGRVSFISSCASLRVFPCFTSCQIVAILYENS